MNFALSFNLAYSVVQMKLIKCLQLFRKISKNTRGPLELLTSIYALPNQGTIDLHVSLEFVIT